MMRRAWILIAAVVLLLPATAGAVTIHQHLTDPVTHKPIVRVVRLAPPDSDDDGCADAADSYNGPGCKPPPPPPVSNPAPAPTPTQVAPATSSSSVGLTAPVDPNCESGGDPTTNTGNGYYGAYQFDSGTWDAYGDPAYGQASDAPMSVQTAAANAVPYDAWPNC